MTKRKTHTLWYLLISLLTALYPSANYAEIIFIVESYHKEYPWDKSYRKALIDTLGSTNRLHFFEMDTKRLPESTFQNQAEKAYEVYEKIQPDIVLLGDDNALKLLGPRLAETNTPTFFLGVNNNPRIYFEGPIPKNITGVLERPIFNRTAVSNLKTLLPDMKRVLILLDDGITSRAIAQGLERKKRGYSGSIQLDIRTHHLLKDWQHSVVTAKEQGYDCIIIGLYQRLFDDNGHRLDPNEVILWTSSHTPLPPFAFWSFAVGDDKAIGGTVVDGYKHGSRSAQQVLQYLGSGKLPTIETPVHGTFIYSQHMLEKWQLSLPEFLRDRGHAL